MKNWTSERLNISAHTGVDIRTSAHDGGHLVLGFVGENWMTDFVLTAEQARAIADVLEQGADELDQTNPES